jgi:undecaprenyl-diphosphatase
MAMVSLLQSLILGLLQGITEFVPVSSSGHLVLVPSLLGWPDAGLAYNAVVHLGTFGAVVTYFWDDLLALVRGWASSLRRETLRARQIVCPNARLAWLIALSALPGVIIGLLFSDFFESLFSTPPAVALLLLVTGAILFASDRYGRRSLGIDRLRWRDALFIGLAQALALAPGISRSGATIGAGLVIGLSREGSARFSFLMAVPLIAGAAALEIAKLLRVGLDGETVAILLVGFLVAAASGYAAIRFLLRYLQHNSLRPFAYYCWGAGLLVLLVTIAR